MTPETLAELPAKVGQVPHAPILKGAALAPSCGPLALTCGQSFLRGCRFIIALHTDRSTMTLACNVGAPGKIRGKEDPSS